MKYLKRRGIASKPKDCLAPKLSRLAKMHKDFVLLRGVVSTVGTAFERLSRYLITVVGTGQDGSETRAS